MRNSLKCLTQFKQKNASYFVESLIDLMSKQIEKACFMTSKGEYNKMETVLWRGRDYDTVKTLSEAFFDKAIELITPEIIFPQTKKRKKAQSDKKIENFEMSLMNLLNGERL